MTKINQRNNKLSADISYESKENSKIMQIVVAESDQAHLQRLMADIRGIGEWIIHPCTEYTELVQALSLGSVDLLILGNLDQGCFEAYSYCRQEWAYLPVILVSHESTIPNFYRQWFSAKEFNEKGLGDVVSSDPINYHHLVWVVQNITAVIRAQKQALSRSPSHHPR